MTKSFSNWTATIAVVGALTGGAPVLSSVFRLCLRAGNPMVNPAAKVVAVVAIMAAGVAAQIDAAQVADMAVVIQVTDDAHILPDVLSEAERLAGSVYLAAGVRIVWTDAIQVAEPAGGFHVDVILRSKDMKAGESQSSSIDGEVLGRTLRPIRRVYVFYDRICEHAMQTGSTVARLLGAVIAHEVGHLLLPDFSHSPTGIMRPHWNGRIVRVPDFTVDQGNTIRTRLADSSTK